MSQCHILRPVLVALALLTVAPADAASVYRWLDADGKPHFGDRPPAREAAEEVEVRVVPPSTTPLPPPRVSPSTAADAVPDDTTAGPTLADQGP